MFLLQKSFHDKSPYTLMFGPDKCGEDKKVILINNEWHCKVFEYSSLSISLGQEQKYKDTGRGSEDDFVCQVRPSKRKFIL